MPEGSTQTRSSASSGQQPGAPATPPANGATPPEPGATDPVSNPEAKKYADEAQAERKRSKALEAELAKFQDAQLTTEQKRERDLATYQQQALEYQLSMQRLTVENAGYRLGSSLGIADISAALALVQSEHGHEIEYDDKTQQPKNLDALLKLVVKDHPLLAGTSAQQRPSAGGATNPSRQATAPGGANGALSWDLIGNMTQDEYNARRTEIQNWMIRHPLRR